MSHRLDDSDPGFGESRPVRREMTASEVALRAVSELAVVWAFGLALLLILAYQT